MGQEPYGTQPLSTTSEDWTRAIEEYRATVAMIQDSGRLIWTINAAFVVLLGLVAKPLLDGSQLSAPYELHWRAGVGLLVALLWAASFERNYGFYVYRINYAKYLEGLLGLRLFLQGATLGDTGKLVLPNQEAVVLSLLGNSRSIQSLTRATIALATVGFLVALVWAFCTA